MSIQIRTLLVAVIIAGFVTIVGIMFLPASPPIRTEVAPTPEVALPSEGPSQQLSPDAAAAVKLLEELDLSEPENQDSYERDEFGQRWADIDRNGCDQRNDVLARDLTEVTTKPGTRDCVVLTGTLDDPYTGMIIPFERGQGTSELVQIDHIVPLAWAWRQGADEWTADERERFANDPLNLQATDGSTNASKSDRGPSEWMPPDNSYDCEYSARFVEILAAYDLTINTPDQSALTTKLTSCSS
ncbi:HNH endonuclease family protein [Microbacterium oleivorans]|uniref:HNH endonuclease family protein n=1 Tax=Microbacterium oleivorans TaxID=273677 RepID=UPI00080DEBC7|nr:HNH endonuclease family protein [Microbacterium oleivorans]